MRLAKLWHRFFFLRNFPESLVYSHNMLITFLTTMTKISCGGIWGRRGFILAHSWRRALILHGRDWIVSGPWNGCSHCIGGPEAMRQDKWHRQLNLKTHPSDPLLPVSIHLLKFHSLPKQTATWEICAEPPESVGAFHIWAETYREITKAGSAMSIMPRWWDTVISMIL